MMERWVGKTAVVTGASSGIGAAISKKFVKSGINVVGLARRLNLLEEIAEELSGETATFHPFKCDVSHEKNILEAFSWVEENFGGISIMVNNAGIYMPTTIINGDSSLWKKTMDVNVLALCICTKNAIKSMKDHDINGQIIHIGSIAGHYVPNIEPPILNVYSPSKHCIRAATETLRKELKYYKSKIKISCVSPGFVETELISGGDDEGLSSGAISVLDPDDIADICLFILSTKPYCQIHDVIVRPIWEEI